MSRKKSKNKKRERRLAEISRAQATVQGNVGDVTSVEKREVENKAVLSRGGYHELPIKEIKKDMVKNAAYLLFAVALIVVLEKFGVYDRLF